MLCQIFLNTGGQNYQSTKSEQSMYLNFFAVIYYYNFVTKTSKMIRAQIREKGNKICNQNFIKV